MISAAWMLAALLAGQSVAAAQVPPRDMTAEDAAQWKDIGNAQLTAGGAWLVYVLRPRYATSAETFVVARSVHGDLERRYPGGPAKLGGGSGLTLTASGRWMAFKMVMPDGTDSGNTGQERPARNRIVAIELATGRRFDFPGGDEFAFNGERDEWIAVRGPASELALHRLSDGRLERFEHVGEFAFDPSGTHLAWTDAHGLRLRELVSGTTRTLDESPGGYRRLTWSGRGNALAALRVERTTGAYGTKDGHMQDARYSLLAFADVRATVPRRRMFMPGEWPGFPAGHVISPDDVKYAPYTIPYVRKALVWREDERGLFLGTRPTEQADVPSKDARPWDLVLWHSRDARLPGRKKFDAAAERAFSYLGFVSLTDGRFVRLADPELAHVEPHGRARYLLGYDSRAYDRELDVQGHAYRDYTLVDIQTGRRTHFGKRMLMPANWLFGIEPQLSPDGAHVLYLDLDNGGHYIAYDVASGARRNLTAGLPAPFFDPVVLKTGIRPRQPEQYPVLQGWTRGGNSALISDGYDVWALPLVDGRPVNLTGNGQRDRIRYVRTDFGAKDEHAQAFPYGEHGRDVDLDRPVYFRAFDMKTRRTGLVRRKPDDGTLQPLRWDDARIRYHKAERADVYVYTRETAVTYPDYHAVDEDWRPAQRLTNANPRQRELRWSPGARLLSYPGPNGEALQSVLHLPAGYVRGRSYPTIVAVYEEVGRKLHLYQFPTEHGAVAATYDIPRWTQHGYAVLLPDIRPRPRAPGAAALEGVLAGVEAAVATGIVDPQRLGLTGQSYGGYETNFIITQTQIFKAAASMAGVSDLFGDYGDAMSGRIPKASIFETYQPYIGGPPWQYRHAFEENSPIVHVERIRTPLLLAHGAVDSIVSFSQSLHLFNALRRLGNRGVVLLQYQGEGHTISSRPENARDLVRRQMEFFDHFLKDAPAPAWWADGTSHYGSDCLSYQSNSGKCGH